MIREDEVYRIGILNKPHGINGELQFSFDDDIFDRVDAEYIVCKIDGILVPFFIEEYRFRSDTTAIIRLEDVDTEQKARRLTNTEVYFPTRHAEGLEPSSLSRNFFEGFRVEETRHGDIGTITGIDSSTINTLFVIDNGGRELLVPAHEEFIRDIDTEHRVITMSLPEGLLDLTDGGGSDQEKDDE